MSLVYNSNDDEFTLTASSVEKDVYKTTMSHCIVPFKELDGNPEDWGKIFFTAIDSSCKLDWVFNAKGELFVKQKTKGWDSQRWAELSAKITKSFKDWKAKRPSGDGAERSETSEHDAEPDTSEVQSTLEWRKGDASTERPFTTSKGQKNAVQTESSTQRPSMTSTNWRAGARSNVTTKRWQNDTDWRNRPAQY